MQQKKPIENDDGTESITRVVSSNKSGTPRVILTNNTDIKPGNLVKIEYKPGGELITIRKIKS